MGKVIEVFSIFWFRAALGVFGLYILHIGASYLSIQVIINVFSIGCVAILGLPGLVVVCIASVLNSGIFY